MPEMIQCVAAELTVLERQTARLQWQKQQQQQQTSLNYNTNTLNTNTSNTNGCYISDNSLLSLPGCDQSSSVSEMVGVQQCLGGFNSVTNGAVDWPDLSSSGYPAEYFRALASVRDPMASAAAAVPSQKQSSSSSSDGAKKRKAANNTTSTQSKAEDSSSEKRVKADTTAMQNKTNTKEAKSDSDKEAPPKQDYIHVRARRGQATDSHSLAERVRRERISERMRYLQELVPGCNKITGKAGMLDEIINYVQSLQRQVEFLSMKLAAVNPTIDFNVDNIFGKEMNTSCSSSISTVALPPDLMDPANYLHLNSLPPATAGYSGIDMAMSNPDLALRRTLTAPITIPNQFLDPCFNVQGATPAWEAEMQAMYTVEFQQGTGRGPVFLPLQLYQGNLVVHDNLKMEM